MFDYENLQSRSRQELEALSRDLGVSIGLDAETIEIIYALLDYQATHKAEVQSYMNEVLPSKASGRGRKKTQINTPESPTNTSNTTDEKKVAQPKPRGRKKSTNTIDVEENIQKENIQKDNPQDTVEEVPPTTPKRRGRPKKNTVPTPQKTETNTKVGIEQNTAERPVDESTPPNPTIAETNTTPEATPETKRQTHKGQNTGRHPREGQNTSQERQSQKDQNDNRQPNSQQRKKEVTFDHLITMTGVLEILSDNYGFLRSSDFNYISSPDDVFVSTNQIRNFGLKNGDTVKAVVRLPKEGEKYYALQKPLEVNGKDLNFIKDRVSFEHLTPLFPQEKFNLAGPGSSLSSRVVDLFSPIGKGQRAMIVAQPKTGKTMLLKDIANSIARNHPEVYLLVLLIDERPEEVTDMKRSVRGEVIASTFDESADKHVKVANIVLAKAQRMVECGHDVVILLDSITRLARAFNTVTPASGKILSGGVDANALHRPKRFFGAARNIENGGSLTIVATALTETGSRMDEVIFEEFKGTGNMELQLDRRVANRRIFPAVDLSASSTRKDDLLHDEITSQRMWLLRKHIADMNPVESMEFLMKHMKGTENNTEFLMSMNK